MKGLVNLTPTNVVVRVNGKDHVIEPSGKVAKLAIDYVHDDLVAGVPCFKAHPSFVEGLPQSTSGTVYITSMAVAQYVHRLDVVAPDIGPSAIRNENNELVAITRFCRFQ